MSAPSTPGSMDFFISPDGTDAWSGTLAEPNADRTDGPLASIKGLLARIRNLTQRPRHLATPHTIGGITGPICVWLRGGRYQVREPITITADDVVPMTFSAYADETPILDGGERITDWVETEENGLRTWKAVLPEVRDGNWRFRQLFVNGERRSRPRLPKKGLFRMAAVPGMPLPAGWGGGGYTQFVAAEGDVRPFQNIADVEVVYVHFWIEERSRIEAYDPAKRLVTMVRPSRTNLVGSHGSQLADYYLDNVVEAMDTPGEWYLNAESGELTYLPLPEESLENTEVVAPKALQLLRLVGNVETGREIADVRFRGITFQHTDWRHPGEEELASQDLLRYPSASRMNRGSYAAASQAAADVPGIIHIEGAKRCGIENCTIRNVGWYGVSVAEGCTGIRIVGNEMYDLGAGAVKVNGAGTGEPVEGRTGWCRITDNHVHQAGQVFHSAVGILCMHSAGNVIAHNHIHHLYYSGISCGWEWGYQASATHDNVIEKNHIHHLGMGLLSDMGGVYLLGVQPGTVVRNNVIHDIEKAHYGGWALYTDEGSSHIVLENNICYRTNGELFHQHYGRENVVRNNVLVIGDDALVAYSRIEPHVGFMFLRNIVVSNGAPMFKQTFTEETRRIISDCNIFWDTSGESPLLNGTHSEPVSLEEWRGLGHDRNSIVADPQFADVSGNDFRLGPDSPALDLGFVPIDVDDVGPRRPELRD